MIMKEIKEAWDIWEKIFWIWEGGIIEIDDGD